MAIFLNTGVPGSGKSYLMVKRLLDNFYRYDNKKRRFVVRPEFSDLVLISNVEGLKLEHLQLETMLEVCAKNACDAHILEKNITDLDEIKRCQRLFYDERLRYFFSVDYWEKQPKKTYVFMIEECQTYFGVHNFSKAKYFDDVIFYFQKHRHLGHSFFLDTQSGSNLNRALYVLIESEMQAKPRTLSVMGEFKYFELSGGHAINTIPKVVRPDKRIFKLYKSMNSLESLKPKKPVAKFFVFLLFGFVFVFVLYKFVLSGLFSDDKAVSGGSDKNGVLYSIPAKSSSDVVAPPSSSAPPSSPQQLGEWVQVNYVLRSDGSLLVEHPVFKSVIKFKELGFPVVRSGKSLFIWLDGTEGKKKEFRPSAPPAPKSNNPIADRIARHKAKGLTDQQISNLEFELMKMDQVVQAERERLGQLK